MRKIALTLLSVFALATAAGSLSACNTTRGVGQDMQSAGQGLSNSAEKNKPY